MEAVLPVVAPVGFVLKPIRGKLAQPMLIVLLLVGQDAVPLRLHVKVTELGAVQFRQTLLVLLVAIIFGVVEQPNKEGV